MNGFLPWAIGFIIATSPLTSEAKTPSCRLDPGRVIRVGCTYNNCGSIVRLRVKIAAAVKHYPIQFVDLTRYDSIEKALDDVDAILLPGGADIHPKYYSNDLPADVRAEIEANFHYYKASYEGDQRDPYEYNFIKTYLGSKNYEDIPVLGICRGMQMLSAASGIPLYVDIKAELGIKNPKKKFQSFQTKKDDSKMHDLFPNGARWAWKNHHQALRYDYFKTYSHLYPNIRVTASSYRDRIPEALEFTDRPVMGVQFHPELSSPRIARRVFGKFLTEACERTKRK